MLHRIGQNMNSMPQIHQEMQTMNSLMQVRYKGRVPIYR